MRMLTAAPAPPLPDNQSLRSRTQRRRKQFSLLFYVLEELQRTNDNTAEELAALEAPPAAMDVDTADAMVP